jgi:anti-sigma factor RsiW
MSERSLSERILDALVDGHGSLADESHVRAWLRKDRSTAVT